MKLKSLTSSLLIGMLAAPCAHASESTTFADMLAKVQRDADVSMEIRPLKRDWIGDISDEKGKKIRMRLEKGRILNGEIALLRIKPNKSHVGSDAPVYVASIPPDEKLRACTTIAELTLLIGRGQPGFSGWGGPNGVHSSHSWVCFSPTADDRLTYLSVFAHTSFNEEQRAKKIAQVNELLIQRGELRPADPDNQKERATYLSGADLFAAEEAAKTTERQRYPQPLRELIQTEEHPDDPDLTHLSAAIQAIRKNPNPKLFAQLVQEMHEGTLRIQSLLHHILLNDDDFLDVKPWGKKEEAIAVGACIDSLPLAQDDARADLVETLLRVCKGGKIEIEDSSDGSSIEVKPTNDGYSLTLGGASNPLPLAKAQEELRHLYAKSRGK